MNNNNEFKYLSQKDLIPGTYITIPKELYISPLYKDLSSDAKLLYGILADRFTLSEINGIKDTRGKTYVISTIEGTMSLLNVSKQKARKTFNELIEKNLLKSEFMDGFNRTKRLYLGKIITNYVGENGGLKMTHGRVKKSTCEGLKSEVILGQNIAPNKPNINKPNINKPNINKPNANKCKEKESFGNSQHKYAYLQEFNFDD